MERKKNACPPTGFVECLVNYLTINKTMMFRGEECMKKFALFLLLLASIFPFSNAQARDSLILGVSAGTAGQQYSDAYTDIWGTSARDGSIGLKIGVPISDYAIIEGAYYDYGEATDNYFDGFGDLITVKTSTKSANFGMAGIFPISYSTADIVGRIGLAVWDSNVEFRDSSLPGVASTDTDDGVSVYFGFGVRTSISQHIRLGLEYTFFSFDTTYIGIAGDQTIDNFALTMDVGF
jgi:hypothetical protein